MALNAKQEAFAQEVVKNGGDKVAAFKLAGWKWEGYSSAALSVQADKQYNHPKIRLRIEELQSQANEVAKEKFSISVEQRLKWLNEIVEAGLGTYADQGGNLRREGLTAARGAIQTMNEMLGVGEKGEGQSGAMTIIFRKDD